MKAIVKSRKKTRQGRGFSLPELKEVKLDFKKALKLEIPTDTKRRTKYDENIKRLKEFLGKR